MRPGCYSLDELRAVARGEAGKEDSDRVLEHCARCDKCGGQLAAMLMLTTTRFDKKGGINNLVLMAAASVLLALVLFAAMGVFEGQEVVSTSPLVVLATTEPMDLRIVQIQLGVAAPVGSANTVDRIQAAGVALAEGRFEEASRGFEAALRQNPSSEVVAAYLGMSRYLNGDDDDPTRVLLETGAGARNQSVATYTQWYLGNHLLRIGLTAEAIAVLEPLSQRPVEPGRNALALLQQIRDLQQ